MRWLRAVKLHLRLLLQSQRRRPHQSCYPHQTFERRLSLFPRATLAMVVDGQVAVATAMGEATLCGILVDVDPASGRALRAEPLRDGPHLPRAMPQRD